ncbi:uncharacterized protein [Blastocystis hominis]|uniref:Uncharacterized protein n=1 Tax=Blastocystis hominis TaxID=12968 RepID=D8M8X5_BLAHO|nr:uncharacterized protein [Blastocystis hominis]CBK24514.2 unnamed protein product [Blastocystis hominis]|eukprot:XP_012898562.1 uncharacterized protein [Blastocystis hominis]
MEEEVTFQVNESVIIEDKGLFYEGRILDVKNGKYYVHFSGWPKRYDKWVEFDDLNKQNEMNRALMKMNNKSNKDKENKPYFKTSLLSELNMVSEIKQKYKFPFLLKQRLVEEWYIVKNRKLFIPLPRSPNIKQILQLWESECKSESSVAHQSAIELIEGLMYYMKNCMDKSIIYHEEESQFCQVNDIKNVNYVEMYGAEHLLRAVYMLPILYSSADISEKESEQIHEVVFSLYQFLLRHPQYFCSFDEYTSLEESIKNLV